MIYRDDIILLREERRRKSAARGMFGSLALLISTLILADYALHAGAANPFMLTVFALASYNIVRFVDHMREYRHNLPSY
jgi:TctA family transporter